MTFRWNQSRSIFLRSSLYHIIACLLSTSRHIKGFKEKSRFHLTTFPSILEGKQNLASTSTDHSEPVPKASLLCFRCLGAPKAGHLEARSVSILSKVPWNHTHSHNAASKSLFAITGKRYKRNIIARVQLPSEAKSVQRRSDQEKIQNLPNKGARVAKTGAVMSPHHRWAAPD